MGDSDSQSQDQESHAPLIEPVRHPIFFTFLKLSFHHQQFPILIQLTLAIFSFIIRVCCDLRNLYLSQGHEDSQIYYKSFNFHLEIYNLRFISCQHAVFLFVFPTDTQLSQCNLWGRMPFQLLCSTIFVVGVIFKSIYLWAVSGFLFCLLH